MSIKIIKINRSDSFNFNISIFKNYILSTSDVVYFALLHPHQKFENAILIKGYTSEDQNKETGEITINITPNDTKCLEPGVYYYTVKLQKGGTLESVIDFDDAEEVHTIIERTKFIINE